MSHAIQMLLQASKYLPASLVVNALSKKNGNLKNFFSQAVAQGFDINRALNFVQEHFTPESQKQFEGSLERGAERGSLRADEAEAQNAIKQSNIPLNIGKTALSMGIPLAGRALAATSLIGQKKQGGEEVAEAPQPIDKKEYPLEMVKKYDIDLGEFLENQINQGRSPKEAVGLASFDYRPNIRRVERVVKQRLEDFLSSSGEIKEEVTEPPKKEGDSYEALLQSLLKELEGLNE